MNPVRLFHVLLLVAVAVMAHAAPSAAQTFPNHVDPFAREDPPDLAAVPAIRFLASPGFPPFSFRDDRGDLIGFNIDLARALCSVVGAQCTIQAWPWDQAADALADNQGDALIAGMAINAETVARFAFSHVYLAFPGRFVVRRVDGEGFDPSETDGPIAVRGRSAHLNWLETYYPDTPVTPYLNELQALEALSRGEAAAFFGDGMRAAFWLNANPSCCRFHGEAYFDLRRFGEGMAIALTPERDVLRRAINWGLARLKADGTYDGLYLKWFPVGFY